MKKIIVIDETCDIRFLRVPEYSNNSQKTEYLPPDDYKFTGFKQNGETLIVFIAPEDYD